jgi:hypothetical protein
VADAGEQQRPPRGIGRTFPECQDPCDAAHQRATRGRRQDSGTDREFTGDLSRRG